MATIDDGITNGLYAHHDMHEYKSTFFSIAVFDMTISLYHYISVILCIFHYLHNLQTSQNILKICIFAQNPIERKLVGLIFPITSNVHKNVKS